MAHLLKHKNTPEPGVWRTVGGDQAKVWREGARQRVATGQSRLEFDRVNQLGIDVAPGDYESGIIEKPRAEKPREPMDTVETLAKMNLDWVLSGTKEQVLHKVRILKKSSGMTHLTDEDAAQQLSQLAFKLARRDAEQRYKEMNLLRPAVIQ